MIQHDDASDSLERLEEHFHELLDLSPDARADRLSAMAKDNQPLAGELKRLLQHHAADDDFLEPLLTSKHEDAATPTANVQDQVGAYRLIREIGSGGMGTVWLAERTEGGFDQKVAIKFASNRWSSHSRMKRFERERRLLASLEHPYVARLIDGGTTPDGLPYLAMEYVEGRPIDTHCHENDVPLRGRLRLFVKVCEAVQYAHQHLIIHRDLKPGNILVNESGDPKLLDFGISTLQESEEGLSLADAQTTSHALMTPRYASPEQLTGGPISTASDVYSLGVMLYELLTGRFPYEVDACTRGEFEGIVCNHDPTVPSTIDLVTTTFTPRELRGDLDNIVLKALSKNPAERYASPQQLADDIDRHLCALPIVARPASIRYRLSKFMRRNRTAVAAGSTVAAILVVSVIGITASMLKAKHAQHDAASAEARSSATVKFFTDLLVSADPFGRSYQGSDYTVRELLDEASAQVDAATDTDPAVEAAIRLTLGKTYRSLSLYDSGEPHLRRALQLREETSGTTSPEYLIARRELGMLVLGKRQLAEAERHINAVVDAMDDVFTGQPAEIVQSIIGMAELERVRGAFSEAASLLNQAATLQTKSNASDVAIAETLQQLGEVRVEEADYAKAEEPLRRALALRRRTFGESHPLVAESMSVLGFGLGQLGQSEEAEQFLTRAYDMKAAHLGEDHPSTGNTALLTAHFYTRIGRIDQAELMYRRVLELERNRVGVEHREYAIVAMSLAHNLRRQKKFDEARALLEQAITALESTHGEEHQLVATATSTLAAVIRYSKPESLEEAGELFKKSYHIRRKLYGDNHAHTMESLIEVASWMNAAGQFEDARQLVEKGMAINDEHFPTARKRKVRLDCVLGESLGGLGQFEKSETILLTAYRQGAEWFGERHWISRNTLSKLIATYTAWGKDTEAEQTRKRLYPDSANTAVASSKK